MLLELKNIQKSFSNTKVLHGVSFSINSGKALGFLGRNGAGKTTTIRILMGLFDCDKGEILLDGKPFNPKEYSIGYLPEERGLYPKQKILEQLIYFGELRGLNNKQAKKNALYWLERLGVLEYKDKKLETLSKGNQQKVQIAETLLCNPDIVILDEPFSGLDPVNSQILKEIIRDLISKDKLVIFSSHQMAYVEEFCEEIALINKGNIVLTGNLDSIKKEYGKNRISLDSANYSTDELNNILSNKIKDIKIVDIKNKDIIIELLNGKTKNQLINNLLSIGIDIEKFSIYEPTLTDIFIQKAGEN
ncbi:MAG: ATP-binding cassette domain-containing protein [Clostridiaceae bacterium]|nr:ATP-binding cassette domain-containing protein [Clostridiaceae bacterium]MBW4860607.1 ATP-binding cassette domain-containing protein [Clostridiaceae bacterium]MBW4868523.1 ATP-binding cassette domain-containing protein [Clostridiaceae bacterium]